MAKNKRNGKKNKRNGKKNKYGLFNFILDVMLTVFTGGFWLIWIFAREMRR